MAGREPPGHPSMNQNNNPNVVLIRPHAPNHE
jgi:hypothetical protein